MRDNQIRLTDLGDAAAFALWRVRGSVWLPAIALLAALTGANGAQAQSLSPLYSFCTSKNNQGYCTDGAQPVGGLISGGTGNLYGTTYSGGSNNAGTVFEVTPTGVETVLYNFCSSTNCRDGELPAAGLVADGSGNLYGTTKYGGNSSSGTVFEIAADGSESVLWNFCSRINCDDGSMPVAGLTGSSGHFYGTTQSGGFGGEGTVFELLQRNGIWVEHKIFYFKGNLEEGGSPQAGVVMDGSGNLFGTTEIGGKWGSGVLFKLTYNSRDKEWDETILHNFCSNRDDPNNPCKDGASPVAGLAFDGAGNLYGTTYQGGWGDPGDGVAFVYSLGKYRVLHHFCNTSGNCSDGLNPLAGLTFNGASKFIGTTQGGTGGTGTAGTVFSLTKSGSEKVLWYFSGNDGSVPAADVIVDSNGDIFGTTANGGKNGGGEVFQLTPQSPSHLQAFRRRLRDH